MNYTSASATTLFAVAMLATPAGASSQLDWQLNAPRKLGSASVCAPWVDAQFARIEELQAHWNQYDADPLQAKTIAQLRSLLIEAHSGSGIAGQIVPGADGSIQAEWHLDTASIGLLVEDDGTYSSWVRFNNTGNQIEEHGIAGLNLFKALVSQYRLNV